MKNILLLFLLLGTITCFGQQTPGKKVLQNLAATYIRSSDNLTLQAAFELANRATQSAALLDKNISIAVLDASGTIILIARGDGVGPHNTEAARRKAFTALSTKTATLLLSRNAKLNPDTQNLNTLPELLLLGGGVPIWHKGHVIGSIGVAGGGNPENDDSIARSATISEIDNTKTK